MQTLDPETLSLEGTAVVEASAGTGKTYTITTLFVRLLLESELAVEQILVVTYTRAATAELRDRIRKRVALALSVARGHGTDDTLLTRLIERARARLGAAAVVERLDLALGGLDRAPVLTIHSFCQRVLRELAFESGSAFEAQLTAHAGPLLEEIVDDYFVRELYDVPLLKAELLLDEPEPLRKLAARVSGRSLRVLPEQVEERPFDAPLFQQRVARCRELFQDDRETIVSLVRTLKGVGKSAVSWAAIVEQLLARGRPAEFLTRTSFVNFTRSGVRAKSKGSPPEHPFFDESELLLEQARSYPEAKQSVALAFRRRFVDYLERELERRTSQSSVRTFDSLLIDLDRALSGPSGELLVQRLRTRYRAALVDEFQDTDPTQYRIFGRIFSSGERERPPLLLIGDPKQAIYGFRGADVAAYLGARAEAQDRVYTLDVNWRSDPALLAALNALYASIDRPFWNDSIDYQPVREKPGASERLRADDGLGAVDLALFDPREQSSDLLRASIARAVASDIARLLASASTRASGARFVPLTPRDFAVLCRTNSEAALVQAALGERGIPSSLSGDASVLDSEDVSQLERALTALAHPGDARALRGFLSSIYGGYDAEALVALESNDADWEQHRLRLQRLHELWLSHGIVQALRALVATYEVEQRLLARRDGLRRITNLWHLAELLAEVASSERLGPLGLLRWLALVQGERARVRELIVDQHELRLESSGDAVTITTVHKSKGLEYPIVYCPFLWDAAKLLESERKLVRFHDPAAEERLTLDLGGQEAHVRIAESEALAEALRLLYVAVTRAKHRVTLVVASSKNLAQSALGYALFGGGGRSADSDSWAHTIESGGLQSLLAARLEATGISLRSLEEAYGERYRAASPSATKLEVRTVRRALDPSYRVTSFSSLVARERSAYGEAGIDRDQVERGELDPKLLDRSASSLPLAPFPLGAVAGQLVHEVLEHAEFDRPESELLQVATRFVRTRGYAEPLAPILTRGLTLALATPLDATGLSLSALSRADRIDELEFVLPVDGLLRPSSLARAFRAHKAPRALPSYAGELTQLGFDALHGYLRGYIDLLFRHRGRFFVVDYKSNWLGPTPADYSPSKLPQAMAEHHYFLQYHLYTVAVHRYLGRRLAGYDYDQHFGGVYYLYLRGMAPEHPTQSGVFFDRPPLALVKALDATLRGEEAES